MFNAEKAKSDVVKWIKEWFKLNGPDCMAVVGISGGKDSTVVAALCVEALGNDRVIGVLMPNGEQSDIEDAWTVADYLGIKTFEINIKEAFDSVLKQIKNASIQTRINVPPRLRMTYLYAISQTLNGRVANTCNLSEDYIGYSTRWGDSVGDFSPLGQFTSEEVVAIGDVLGLPKYLTHKVPSDGLCGKNDEDNFGFTYAVLNRYIRTGECKNQEIKARIDALHQKNLFKLRPVPQFTYQEEK